MAFTIVLRRETLNVPLFSRKTKTFKTRDKRQETRDKRLDKDQGKIICGQDKLNDRQGQAERKRALTLNITLTLNPKSKL